VSSLKHQGITQIAVPRSSLVPFLALSMLLGLVAATWPARRAARMDMLSAIAAG
jgi:putative ABC transport system permease protein